MNYKRPIAGVILAAGISKRFGRLKQLVKFNGKTLIETVLDTALESNLDQITVVLGKDYEKVVKTVSDKLNIKRLSSVINNNYIYGQSTSVKAGLSAVMDRFNSAMFIVADQPLLSSKIIDNLILKFTESEKDICVPLCKGDRKNPVIFSRNLYPDILKLKGDGGAKELIKANRYRTLFVDIDEPLCFFDIDTHKDLEIVEEKVFSSEKA